MSDRLSKENISQCNLDNYQRYLEWRPAMVSLKSIKHHDLWNFSIKLLYGVRPNDYQNVDSKWLMLVTRTIREVEDQMWIGVNIRDEQLLDCSDLSFTNSRI